MTDDNTLIIATQALLAEVEWILKGNPPRKLALYTAAENARRALAEGRKDHGNE